MAQSPDNLLLKIGAPIGLPPSGYLVLFADTDGVTKLLDSSGNKISFGGDRSQRSIIAQSAASVLPAGFSDWFTDLQGGQDHAVSFTAGLNAASAAAVSTESGGKRRLTTQVTATQAAEILPYWEAPSVGQSLAVMINPKSSAWYVEGRAAIETHAATSALFPCSIAITGAAMVGTITSNTFVGLGLVGSNFSGGNNSFLSLASSSGGTVLVQTTTIPWVATMQTYSLQFDGSGTITARAYAADGTIQTWTTTNLNQIYGAAAGFYPNQWVLCSDTSSTTMLCDYLYGAGPRI